MQPTSIDTGFFIYGGDCVINLKRYGSIALCILMIMATLIPNSSYALDTTALSSEIVGPGLFTSNLIVTRDNEVIKVGEVKIHNSNQSLVVTVETDTPWTLENAFIHVGDSVPTESDNALDKNAFNYSKENLNGKTSYTMELSLVSDLDISWGKIDELKRLPVIAVVVDVQGYDGVVSSAYMNGTIEYYNAQAVRYHIDHPKTGHFVDSPVKGLNYKTNTHKGKTDQSGTFEYMKGEVVEFYIGSMLIGVSRGKQKVTPIDLVHGESVDDPSVVNMARLIQSFDDDGDIKAGIAFNEEAVEAFEEVTDELGLQSIDFNDTAMVDFIIAETDMRTSGGLQIVSSEDAQKHMSEYVENEMMRKNVSKTSDLTNTKAKLELMTKYVTARRANDDPVTMTYQYYEGDDPEGNPQYITSTRDIVKPLVSCYVEEVEGTDGSDVVVAISRDEGETWHRTNVSNSADKSSFKTEDGYEYPGTVKKPQIRVRGNYILVAWTSKFASSGSPKYSKNSDAADYEEDIWGVGGPQNSIDYTDEGFPEVGEVPFSAVWTCRGVINSEGYITWYKPERLTSGRRDAYQLMFTGVENVGFALVWQEDPEGLRPGEEAGPGEGWSGATTSHKSDIWYSFIKWDEFADIDEDFESQGTNDESDTGKGKVKAEYHMSLPVRISDNDTINRDNMKIRFLGERENPEDPEGSDGSEGAEGIGDEPEEEPYTDDDAIDDADFGDVIEIDPDGIEPEVGEKAGAYRYGYVDLSQYYSYYTGGRITNRVYKKNNNNEDSKAVAITSDGRLMDGNTGASRPNIMIQTYKNDGGKTVAVAVVCYEETKGLGAGPPDETESSGNQGEKPEDGTGEMKGQTEYVPDEGKNVIYHTFPFTEPDLVSPGTIINKPVTDENGDIVYITDEEGNLILDWDGSEIPSYENARRPRLLIQGQKPAQAAAGKNANGLGTSLVMLYKQGEEGKGRPSDIFMQRWVVSKSDNSNPYSVDKMVEEPVNISSVTVTQTMENTNEDKSNEGNGDALKIMRWTQEESNLNDKSSTNPYDDARAHRGILRGNDLAIAYDWTPNWAASRNGNDKYDVYLRRSFDGGATFTTNPDGQGDVVHGNSFKTNVGNGEPNNEGEKIIPEIEYSYYGVGEYEPARNLSGLNNSKETVIEPRLVGGPKTILQSGEKDEVGISVSGKWCYPEDLRDLSTFWITYGTSSHPKKNDDGSPTPRDLFYSFTSDFGDTFKEDVKTIKEDSDGGRGGQQVHGWHWLAKDTGEKVATQAECQIRMSPSGTIFYALWNEETEDSCDVIFRRIITDGTIITAEDKETDDSGPVIKVHGVNNLDTVSEPVNVNVYLDEIGVWSAELAFDGTVEQHDESFVVAVPEERTDYSLTVTAEDLKGNTSVKKLGFTIDKNVPMIDITGVANGQYSKEKVQINISTSGMTEHLSLKRNGKSIPVHNGVELEDEGAYKLKVMSTSGDLVAEESLDFVIDRTAPVIHIDNVEDGVVYQKQAKPIVAVTDNIEVPLKTFDVTLNGQAFPSSSIISVADDYVLHVFAEDEAGNVSEKSIEFSVVNPSSSTIGGGSSSSSSSSSSGSTSKTPVSEVIEEEQAPQATPTEVISGEFDSLENRKINVFNQPLTIFIPKGTFAGTVTYTVTAVDASEGTEGIGFGNKVYDIEFFSYGGQAITEFNQDIQLMFKLSPEDLPEGVDVKDIKVSYYDDLLNQWIALPSEISGDYFLVNINHLSKFAFKVFEDFPALADCKGHWAEREIYRIASLGIVSGDDAGDFIPERYVYREEMAKILVEALDLKASGDVEFADEDQVSPWAVDYVNAAISSGAMVVDENGMFNPRSYAMRADFILAAKNIFSLEMEESVSLDFADLDQLDADLHQTMMLLMSNDIITGYPDETLRPNDYIKRCEMIKIISRYLESESLKGGI